MLQPGTRSVGLQGTGMPGTGVPGEKRNDGWWISLVLRSVVLFCVSDFYGALFTDNWGLWWSGIFAPGSASRRFLLWPARLEAPYWHSVNAALHWLATHPFRSLIHAGGFSGLFWGLAAGFLGYIPLAFLWTIFDRRKRSNVVLSEVIYHAVRYLLATVMFLYGASKVFGHQGIPQPAPLGWFRPLGDISTGQLMWTWLGYSPIFQFFAGLNETLGAILLLFRRTTLLGALLILPVMAFVTALDTTFHVGPAGAALLFGIGALYLILREWRRLARVFLLGKPTVAPPRKKLWTSRRLTLIGRGVWAVLVAYSLWSYVLPVLRQNADIGGRQSPLCGAYRVERFVKDGRVFPEDGTDLTRWRDVSINRFGDFIRIRTMDDAEWLWSAYPGDPYRFLVASGHGYRYGDFGQLLARTAGTQEQLRFKALPNFRSPDATPINAGVTRSAASMSHYSSGRFFTVNIVRQDAGHVLLQGQIDGADISADLVRIKNNDFEFFRTRGVLP
jgi:hypothetical protein